MKWRCPGINNETGEFVDQTDGRVVRVRPSGAADYAAAVGLAAMKAHPGLLLLLAISLPLSAGEEECIFDQDRQRLKYKELEKQYTGSKYIEEEYRLVIPRGNSRVHLGIGGCVHYGVAIELIQPGTNKYQSEKTFFAEIIRLVQEYGQGMADTNKLKTLLDQKKWTEMSDNDGRYYFVHYDDVTVFEIYQRNEDSQTIVGVSFYD
jgi:hypothetical protein